MFGLTVIMCLVLLGISISVIPMGSDSISFEVDVKASVYRVVDGDTYDAFPIGRVRLADINAPELDTPEGEAAKQALYNLIYGKTAYLDVDDIYVIDKYNRVIAVTYARINETHLLNVNKWLVDNGYAVISDYPNEFNPYTWTLYIYYPTWMEETITTITNTKTITTTETTIKTITETAGTTITTTIPHTITKTVTETKEITSITTLTKTITTAYTAITITKTATLARTKTTTQTITKTTLLTQTTTTTKPITHTETTTMPTTIIKATTIPKTIIQPTTITTTVESYVALGGGIFLASIIALIAIVLTKVVRR